MTTKIEDNMILYKPLEEILAELEKQAKLHDRKGFVQTSIKFYAQMGELSRRMELIQTHKYDKEDSQRHYQTRYNQLKFILRGQKDFGQLHEGSD